MAPAQELDVQQKRELEKKDESTIPARLFLPNTDIFETEDALTVVMEMPGVNREHADITGCRIVLPHEPEAVLLGAAILGAVAAGDFGSVLEAMGALDQTGDALEPAGGPVAEYHRAKHVVFQQMYDAFVAYREIMARV